MYPPLWASLLVAMHDDIENASIVIIVYKSLSNISRQKTGIILCDVYTVSRFTHLRAQQVSTEEILRTFQCKVFGETPHLNNV